MNQEQLLEDLGSPTTNRVVARLRNFAYLLPHVLDNLAEKAMQESWGTDLYVLEKYVAVHTAWSIEQGRFTTDGNQFYVTAGHLTTRYGTPIYLVYETNRNVGKQPWCLKRADVDVFAPELPTPPQIPGGREIPCGAEVVMRHDHMLQDRADRVPFLSQTPPVAQMCAIAGAIQWSINRGLQIPYWYFGRMDYLVPLYLQSRENITLGPDLIAPVQVNAESLLVRTVLLPHMPYPNARVAVQRNDQLPPWLLDSWREHSTGVSPEEMDNPEGEADE